MLSLMASLSLYAFSMMERYANVIYLGGKKMSMASSINEEAINFSYNLVDISDNPEVSYHSNYNWNDGLNTMLNKLYG